MIEPTPAPIEIAPEDAPDVIQVISLLTQLLEVVLDEES